MTGRRVRTWALTLAALGLAALALYLVVQVRSLSGQLSELRAAVADQPAPQVVLPPAPPPAERVDYDHLAAGIAAQLRQGAGGVTAPHAPPGKASASASAPAPDHEAEALADDAMAPYLRRTDLTPEAWNDLGRRVTAISEDKRDAVLRQIFAAITRRELVPPPGISFSDAFY